MKVFTISQEKELKKIAEYIVSKDPEISKMGIQCLRSSSIYKNLKPASLFYYSGGSNTYSVTRVRVSTFINQTVKNIFTNEPTAFTKAVYRTRLLKMFELLVSKDAHSYFRREFINTARFF